MRRLIPSLPDRVAKWRIGSRLTWLIVGSAALVLLAAPASATVRPAAANPVQYRYVRVDDPARTLVYNQSDILVATLTDGARTALFRGPRRTFAEPASTTATVSTRAWVRIAPLPWRVAGEHDGALGRWLAQELTDREIDVLGVAMQYRHGSPNLYDKKGRRYAGHANFGPIVNGERVDDSDFNDYLGVRWVYPEGVVRRPDPIRKGSLDCSGFLRMVYGYRSGYPLGWAKPDGRFPRQANTIAHSDLGAIIIPDTDARPPAEQLARLQAGDLLFFDARDDNGAAEDHSAIFLGVDSAGQPRFISSRKLPNGPTMGDKNGASVLSGDGVFARAFRTSKRI